MRRRRCSPERKSFSRRILNCHPRRARSAREGNPGETNSTGVRRTTWIPFPSRATARSAGDDNRVWWSRSLRPVLIEQRPIRARRTSGLRLVSSLISRRHESSQTLLARSVQPPRLLCLNGAFPSVTWFRLPAPRAGARKLAPLPVWSCGISTSAAAKTPTCVSHPEVEYPDEDYKPKVEDFYDRLSALILPRFAGED